MVRFRDEFHTYNLKMIILPIINFVLPLMLTCLVLIDNPPRCSECRKKMGMTVLENKIDEFAQIDDSNDFNVKYALDKFGKK